jgi:hypothetical protein
VVGSKCRRLLRPGWPSDVFATCSGRRGWLSCSDEPALGGRRGREPNQGGSWVVVQVPHRTPRTRGHGRGRRDIATVLAPAALGGPGGSSRVPCAEPFRGAKPARPRSTTTENGGRSSAAALSTREGGPGTIIRSGARSHESRSSNLPGSTPAPRQCLRHQQRQTVGRGALRDGGRAGPLAPSSIP